MNDPDASTEAQLGSQTIATLVASGVTVRDPRTTYVEQGVEIGKGTVLYPGVILESGTVIGAGCTIHARVRITRCRLEENVVVHRIRLKNIASESADHFWIGSIFTSMFRQ